jgi:hypothetical protein
VETSDGKQLVLENSAGIPEVGQELDIDSVEAERGEIRPLRPGDAYPAMLDSISQ